MWELEGDKWPLLERDVKQIAGNGMFLLLESAQRFNISIGNISLW